MMNARDELAEAIGVHLDTARAHMLSATEMLIAAGKSIPARREAKTLMGEILIAIMALQSMIKEIQPERQTRCTEVRS